MSKDEIFEKRLFIFSELKFVDNSITCLMFSVLFSIVIIGLNIIHLLLLISIFLDWIVLNNSKSELNSLIIVSDRNLSLI